MTTETLTPKQQEAWDYLASLPKEEALAVARAVIRICEEEKNRDRC